MRTLTRVTIALVTGGLVLLTNGPATAAGLHTPVPALTPLVVTGNGYGHGHGMSQYGAKGAAAAGLGYQQILSFYYPGTALATVSGTIKVLITRDTDNNTTVIPTRGLRVRDLGNGRTYRLHTKRTPRVWRLMTVHGHTKLFYRTSRWHLYRTGGRRSLAGDGEFRATARQVTLKLPTGPRTYRGGLRYSNGDTVNVVRLENYLKGVIAAEMPASWADAALQAQAVAARTYAVRSRADNAGRYYQICDTTACQVYGGVAAEQPGSTAAAAATAGQALTFAGQYAFAQFASSSGGWTSAGSAPYLTSHDDPYDRAVSPYLHWQVTIDPAKLQTLHPEIGTLQTVQIVTRENTGTAAEWGGWVQTILLHGDKADVVISGDDFRRLYGLRSSFFTITQVT